MNAIKTITLVLFLVFFRSSFAGYTIFIDDRAAFNAELTTNAASTVIDDSGNFAPDPADTNAVPSINRAGNIGADGYVYDIYDINFSLTPNGMITPAVVGDDIDSLTNEDIEVPAAQAGGAGTGSWGVDSSGGSNTTKNAALFDFTTTPGGNGIGHFGVDLIDFESDPAFTTGEVRLYDGGNLVFSNPIVWPASNGDGEVHFIGIVADDPADFFDQAVFVVGDTGNNQGFSQRWAADRFTFGQAFNNVIPAPTNIPTLSHWATLLLIFILLLTSRLNNTFYKRDVKLTRPN